MNLRIIVFLCLFVTVGSMLAQVPKFSKYSIRETGAGLYMPAEPIWEISYSDDSSKLYTAEVEFGGVNYGAIIVKFAESLGDNSKDWQNMIVSYLEYLNKSVFEFESVVDPGFGHKLESHPEAVGVLQYAEDQEGYDYVIKAWADSKYMAVLFVSYRDEMNFNYREIYLNGFRFP
jgi:hypothetical protein